MSRSYKKPYVQIVGTKARSLKNVKRSANRRFRRCLKRSDEKISHRKFTDLEWNEDLIFKRSIRVEDTRK